MVVVQLVEQLLLTAEICSSNPDIGKILSTDCTIEKTKIKKRGREWPIFKKVFILLRSNYAFQPNYLLVHVGPHVELLSRLVVLRRREVLAKLVIVFVQLAGAIINDL